MLGGSVDMRLVSFRRASDQIRAGVSVEHGIIDIHEGMALISEDRPLDALALSTIIRGTHDSTHLGSVVLLDEIVASQQQAGMDIAQWFGGVEMLVRRHDVQLTAPLVDLQAWRRTAQHVQAYESLLRRQGQHIPLHWYERAPLWPALASSLYGDRAVVPFPTTTMCDVECEIAWVTQSDLHNADVGEAHDAILGLFMIGQVVARDRADDDVLHGLWSRPSGAVMGPMITTMDELPEFVLPDGRLRIEMQILVNDVRVAQMNLRDVQYTMAEVTAHASDNCVIPAGSVFSSGVLTSISHNSGIWLVPGDDVIIDAGPLGTLRWSMEDW
jgi:2-keto-4-pentenoate hydratase/2-oxohepta-3-ene-1,7-dioic acid hydratase in catechol pathway